MPSTSVPAVALGADAAATLPPAMYPRDLQRVNLTGVSGRAELYLGNTSQSARFDQTSRGASNTAEYTHPVPVPAGMTVIVLWLGRAANAASCFATFTTDR